MPAFSIAVFIFVAVPARPPNSPSVDSSRAIVGSDTEEWLAKSPWDQPSKALAAFICRTVTKSISL
jgi:hypothetical protein